MFKNTRQTRLELQSKGFTLIPSTETRFYKIVSYLIDTIELWNNQSTNTIETNQCVVEFNSAIRENYLATLEENEYKPTQIRFLK